MDIELLKNAAAQFKQALQRDDRTNLVAAANILIDQKAPLNSQWLGAALQLSRWGELTLALKALHFWNEQGAPAFAADHEKAVLLARSGRSAEALACLKGMPDDQPSIVANAYLRGSIATNLGDAAEAQRQFRRAIAADHGSGRSWLGLAQSGPISREEEAQLRRMAQSALFKGETDQAAVENALGLLDHGRGDYAAAFAHYRQSTEILGKLLRYNASDNRASANVARRWDAGLIARYARPQPEAERRPIFVSGIPRSGTTLVERILSAHSGVDGGGELGLAVQIEATANGFAPEDFDRYLRSGGHIDTLRQLYLRLATERLSGSGMFIDKSLNQSRSLGPFSVLFRDAPVIWLRRDPMDNAWSIYRAWLANSVVGAWEFGDIADHMLIEDQLFAHWRKQLGGRLLEVPYGELVADPPAWVERITRHCGLEPEAQQIDFHRNESAVTTASAMQVRRPVNRSGLGVSEPYRPFMAAFESAYCGDSALPAFGSQSHH
ncbi:tetratricopeptide repeat-containing sulfotransferase family protein [Sphingosinithalassobacter portus]|uniref:tetratricopeptide repeat-containing sulfotransferase family protein n=1 Tax=Stakelama portus TaxID=2676234 RepID=UPI000D6DE2C1|nr:sulfotransferase [Sphingosinithalassobacter portus]